MMQAYIVYPGQQDFVEALQQNTNVGVKRFRGKGKTIYERLNYNPRLKKIFYDYMENYSAYANKELLKYVDFSKDFNILDIGGGGGNNAVAIAKSNPNSKIIILDLPAAEKIANVNIRINRLEKRIQFFTSNFFKDKFPKNQDCIFFIHQLVIWSQTQNKRLLKKAYGSLKKNGRVVIFNSVAEDNEHGPLMAALDTVYFKAVAAGNGMIYPWKDYKKMLIDAGFKRIKFIRCNTWTPHGIIIGYK